MKPVIYLASDSTVQSYPSSSQPQTGWGQVLISYFSKEGEAVRAYHPQTTSFPHVMRYETQQIAVDNRAFAGRSARTFWEEGRFADMEPHFHAGDYLFFQFAHNDANEKKPERYIPVSDYPLWLDRYVQACRRAFVTPVLVTAIAMRIFEPDGSLPVSFPEYRDAMLEYAAKNGVACLDLGEATRARCEALGPERTRELYMWLQKGEYPGGPYCEGKEDNAHLKREGALLFAALLADRIRSCPALSPLASYLNEKQIDAVLSSYY